MKNKLGPYELENKMANQGFAKELFSDLGNQRSDDKQNIKANCPFCPSDDFSFRTNKPLFRCWGCGEGGDWIDYLEKKEGLTPQEAYHRLAQMGGYDSENLEVSQEYIEKRKKWKLFGEVHTYSEEKLFSPEGEEVLDYLRDRGYSEDEIQDMGLGACVDRGQLVTHLKAEGFSKDEIKEHGIFAGGNHQGFGITHKLIIPWKNSYGKAIGFAGRIIDPELEEEGRKYYFPAGFKKSETFIGLESTRTSDEVIIVEGMLDALYLNAYDFPAIGTGGSNGLNDSQIDILNELDPSQIVIAYDDDGSGKEGTEKIIKQVHDADFSTYVATLGNYNDPDELLRQEGPERFQQSLKEADRGAKWLGKYIIHRNDLDTDRGMDKTIDEALGARGELEGYARSDFDQVVKSELGDSGDRYTELAREAAEEDTQRKAEDVQQKTRKRLQGLENPKPDEVEQILSDGLADIKKESGPVVEPYTMEDFMEEIKDSVPGLKTGIEELDRRIRIPQGALTVVAGRPGQGKTTFMLNLLRKMAKQNEDKKFCFFTYEESRDRLVTKLLMAESGEVLDDSYQGTSNFQKFRSFLCRREGGQKNPKIEESIAELVQYQ